MRCGRGMSGLLMSGRSELVMVDPDVCSASVFKLMAWHADELVDNECCTYIFPCIPRLKNIIP